MTLKRWPRLLAPLRHRQFGRICCGQFVSSVGNGIFAVALPLAVLRGGRGPFVLGIILAGDAIGGVAGSLVGGLLADRVGRVRVMVASDVLRMLAVLGFAASYRGSVALATGCALVVGFGGSIFSPAYFSIVPSLVPDSELQSANGLRTATTQASRIVGPVLGSFVVVGYSATAGFIVDASTFIISVVTLVGIRDAVAEAKVEPALKAARQGLGAVMGQSRWIGAVMLQGAVQMGFVIGPEAILLPIALHSEGVLSDLGWILGLQAVGTLMGALIASRWHPTRPGLAAILAIAAVSVELVCLAASASVFAIGASVVATGWGYTTFAVFYGTALQREVPRELLSRVASLDSLAGSVLLPICTAVTGAAVAGVGLRAVVIVSLVVLGLSTALPLLVRGVPEFSSPTVVEEPA